MIRKLTVDSDGPYHRPHDSWSLEASSMGGMAVEGSPILIQKCGLRLRRRQFTLAITAFTIGALLILMQSPIRNNLLAPGALTSNHAQILAGQGTDRCAACHSVGNQSFSLWLQNAFIPGRRIQACQSELCMKCHEKSINAESATAPHNVAAMELKAITDRIAPLSGQTSRAVANNDIQCSACHREHHGPADLTRLTDQQCQSCHSSGFHKFESDHPEFVNWPHQRRQGIAFDHVSHSGKHFQAKGESFDCSGCHVGGDFGNVQLLLPYEQSCARCHDTNIVSRSEPGLRLVSVPILDLDAIKARRMSIGDWPEDATGDFDGRISGLMRLLLQSDDRAAKILDRRGPEFDFADLDPDLENDVAEAVALAWAIKDLLYQLATEGPDAIRQRFEFVLGRSISSVEFEVFAGGLESTALAEAAYDWFPRLATEVPLHRVQTTGPATAIFTRRRQNFANINDQEDATLLAVNPLARLLTEPVSSENSGEQQIDAASGRPDHGPSTVGQDGNTQSPLPTARPVVPESERLAENPIRDYRAAGASAEPGNSSEQFSDSRSKTPDLATAGPMKSKNWIAVDEPPQKPASDYSGRITDSVQRRPRDREMKFEVRPTLSNRPLIGSTSAGFWVRNDRLYQIQYLPLGHADKILATWMNVVAATPDAARNSATATAFREMTSPESLGACHQCHTIDSHADNSYRVNWQPLQRDPQVKLFTKFSHGSHLIQPQLADCTGCHLMTNDLTNAHSFRHFDVADRISNFAPITKANCTGCHRSDGAGNGCTQCHNYHVSSKFGALR